MVVDDDDDCRSVVRELLETHGFEVSEARDGRAALTCMLLTEEPALVVLDLEMPVMSGTELINLMSRNDRLSRIPVLVLSGSQPAIVPRRSGVVGFICKPFDSVRFVHTVRSYVANSSAARQR